jgi:hypothetical protein
MVEFQCSSTFHWQTRMRVLAALNVINAINVLSFIVTFWANTFIIKNKISA